MAALCVCAPSVNAQSSKSMTSLSDSQINKMKNVDIASLPEETVKTYADKIKATGMNLDTFLDAARSKGASGKQISQLRRRFARYFKDNAELSNSTVSALEESEDGEVMLSSRDITRAPVNLADTLVFGYEVFNREGLTFDAKANLTVGDSYVLGIGDEVAVDVYGATDQTYEGTVGSDGTIVISMVGPIKIGGLTIEEARKAVTTKLRRIHSDIGSQSKVSLRVTNTQPVTVSVMGEAHMPGTYTVSSSSSLFNVLYLSGGPSIAGSYRDIQLIRGGRIIAHLDIYDYLLNGKDDANPSLSNGDIVMIPTYAKRVSVTGQFKRNGIFEAKEGETIADIIRYAGGFTPEAMTDHVGLYRVGKYTTEYKDVTDPGSEIVVNGDKINCGAKNTARVDNAVTIKGSVFAPGVFEYTEGLTLKSLIEKAGGLTENAFLPRGVISRYKEDFTLEAVNFNVLDVANGVTDITLKANDVITIAAIDDMREKPNVEITGMVANPGTFEYHENLTLGDLIVLAGGLQEYAALPSVEIIRRVETEDPNSDAKKIETVTITKDLSLADAGNNFKLEPFDMVNIHSTFAASVGGSIQVTGAVVSPGTFGLTKNTMRISEVLQRCGGFMPSANIGGTRIFRKFVISDVERDIRIRKSSQKNDTATYYLRTKDDVYEYVAFNPTKALENPGSEADILLRDGDIVEVPEMTQTVRVSGQVQNPSNIIYQKRWRANDVIDAAGGFAARALKRKTYVVYANGESKQTHNILFFRRYPKVAPGAEVIVPVKPESTMSLPTIITMSTSIVSMAVVISTLVK